MHQVALGASSLWSKQELDILGIHPEFVSHILLRTGTNSLDISFYSEDEDSEDLRQELVQYPWFSASLFKRAERLDLWADLEFISTVASLFPRSQDMGCLRRLSAVPNTIETATELPMPLQLLPGVTDLKVQGYVVPWRSPLVSSNLTRLCLIHQDGDPRSLYTEARAALTRLHSLKKLVMGDLAPLMDSIGVDSPTLTLPQSLERLTIECHDYDTPIDGVIFVSLLRPPPHCVCDYNVRGICGNTNDTAVLEEDALDEAVREIFRLCIAPLREVDEVQHLLLAHSSMRLASTMIRPQISMSEWQPWQMDPETVTSYVQLDDEQLSLRLLNTSITYISNMNLDRLRTISFDIKLVSMLEQADLWVPLFEKAAGIRRIGMVNSKGDLNDYSILLDTLRKPHEHRQAEGTRMLVPHLEVLSLYLYSEEAAHEALMTSLLELVRARHEHGTPLRELVVPKWTGHWAVWMTLRQAALRITFIGAPQHPSLPHSPLMPEHPPRHS